MEKKIIIILFILNTLISCQSNENELNYKYFVNYKKNLNITEIEISLIKKNEVLRKRYFYVKNAQLYEVLSIKKNILDFKNEEIPKKIIINISEIIHSETIDYFDLLGVGENERNDIQLSGKWDYFTQNIQTKGELLLTKRGVGLNTDFEIYHFDKNFKLINVYF